MAAQGEKRRGRLSRRAVVSTVALVLVLGAAAGGYAVATARSDQALIHACYNKQTGAMFHRAYCTSSEKHLWWPAVQPAEPRAVFEAFEPEAGAELKLIEGVNAIMSVTLPKAWAKDNRLQVVLATVELENRGVGLPDVACTAGRGGTRFSVPGPFGQRPFFLAASFQAEAGEARVVTLVCDVIDPTSPPDVRVRRATLTVLPQS